MLTMNGLSERGGNTPTSLIAPDSVLCEAKAICGTSLPRG